MNSMAALHDFNSEVELLQRKNRGLKLALSIVASLLLIAPCASTLVALRASRAEAYACQQAERARVEAVRALKDAEDAREQTENQNEVEP